MKVFSLFVHYIVERPLAMTRAILKLNRVIVIFVKEFSEYI